MFGCVFSKEIGISSCFFLFSILIPFCKQDDEIIPEDLMREAYQSYKNALHIEDGTVSARRVMSNKKQYEIHVMKLNEVNGYKRHNLLIKESNETNPLLYIGNPVESKLPNAYLTLEEFKKALSDRVRASGQHFVTNVSKARTTTKPKATSQAKDKDVKAFKRFVNRLIELQKVDVKRNATNKNKNRNPVFKIFTLKTDAQTTTSAKLVKNNTNKATKATEVKKSNTDVIGVTTEPIVPTIEIGTTIESPMLAAVTEKPDPEVQVQQFLRENQQPISAERQSSSDKLVSETKTENPVLELEEYEPRAEESEPMTEEIVSSTIFTTTEEIMTKRSTLGKPLVWVNDEFEREDK